MERSDRIPCVRQLLHGLNVRHSPISCLHRTALTSTLYWSCFSLLVLTKTEWFHPYHDILIQGVLHCTIRFARTGLQTCVCRGWFFAASGSLFSGSLHVIPCEQLVSPSCWAGLDPFPCAGEFRKFKIAKYKGLVSASHASRRSSFAVFTADVLCQFCNFAAWRFLDWRCNSIELSTWYSTAINKPAQAVLGLPDHTSRDIISSWNPCNIYSCRVVT